MREEVPAALSGQRVDRVIAMLTGLARGDVARLVEGGGVRIGGRSVTTRSRRLTEGEVLDVDVPAERPPAVVVPEPGVEVPVVHADESVVVVDKPAGLVVHPGAGNPTGTLVHGLVARFPDLAQVGDPARPGVVHRLDKGTSGLLVVARTDAAAASLVAQLQARSVDRRYLTLVEGVPEADAGLIDAPLGRGANDATRVVVSSRGREARTRYRVLERFEGSGSALLECRLETGRTHQVRVHLAAVGHPVVGDARYGHVEPGLDRPFLHAARLAFDHPTTGDRLSFDSALPDDLAQLLDRRRQVR